MSVVPGFAAVLRDTTAMTRRDLYHYLRVPALLAVAVTQAVLFVVMFTYVFKGAIRTPGVAYVDYLMPGVLVLAVAFGSPNTGVGLAEDLTTGMLDRFRSLPMARTALLAGRTLADAIRNLLVVIVMLAVGHLIGFRFHAGPLAAVAAIAIPVAVGYVLSWFAALIGLATGDTETASTASLLPVIPLAFTSSAFVPIDTMPGPLQAWADINPITHIIDAIRNPRPRRPHHHTPPASPRLAHRPRGGRHPPGHAALPPRHPLTSRTATDPHRRINRFNEAARLIPGHPTSTAASRRPTSSSIAWPTAG